MGGLLNLIEAKWVTLRVIIEIWDASITSFFISSIQSWIRVFTTS